MSPIRTSPDFLTLFFSYVYLNVLSLGKYIITFGYIFNVPFVLLGIFGKVLLDDSM